MLPLLVQNLWTIVKQQTTTSKWSMSDEISYRHHHHRCLWQFYEAFYYRMAFVSVLNLHLGCVYDNARKDGKITNKHVIVIVIEFRWQTLSKMQRIMIRKETNSIFTQSQQHIFSSWCVCLYVLPNAKCDVAVVSVIFVVRFSSFFRCLCLCEYVNMCVCK